MRTTNIRFTGLASGLDTESMVQALSMPYKQRVDSSKQNEALMKLKKDTWKEINSKVYNFYTKTLSDLKFKTSLGKSNVTTSNSNLIYIDKSANIPNGDYELAVKQKATYTKVNTKDITVSKGSNTELNELGIGDNDEITIEVGGKTVTVQGGVKKDEQGNPILDANGKQIQKTIKDLEAEVNAQLGEDLKFKFDTTLNKFLISSKSTGEQEITITGSMIDELGIEVDAVTSQATTTKGKNAIVNYEGVDIEQSSNTFSVDGLKFTITADPVFSAPAKGEKVSITSTRNVDSAMESIVGFVEEYNKLIEEMNKLVDTPANRSYKPLTDDEKKEMSDNDIELWEKKVKDGVLSKDPVLQNVLGDMRGVVGSSKLNQIGISTGQNWKEKGKLYIDEEKLRKALEETPEKVDSIMKEVGTKLYDNLREDFKGTTQKSSNFLFNDKALDEKIKDQEAETLKLEAKYQAAEDRYYKQFTTMEKMLSQLNSQSSALMSQLG